MNHNHHNKPNNNRAERKPNCACGKECLGCSAEKLQHAEHEHRLDASPSTYFNFIHRTLDTALFNLLTCHLYPLGGGYTKKILNFKT